MLYVTILSLRPEKIRLLYSVQRSLLSNNTQTQLAFSAEYVRVTNSPVERFNTCGAAAWAGRYMLRRLPTRNKFSLPPLSRFSRTASDRKQGVGPGYEARQCLHAVLSALFLCCSLASEDNSTAHPLSLYAITSVSYYYCNLYPVSSTAHRMYSNDS